MNPKISVIIPVYNVAPFLTRCLDSLRKQTMHDLEIICIDDSSTDDSMVVLNMAAIRDPRVKILKTEKNSGPGFARNIGMDTARGKYISFIDPDDYIAPDYFELMYRAAENENAQVAIGNMKIFSDRGLGRKIKLKKENFLFQFRSWRGLYNFEFVKSIGARFAETYIADDTLFEMSVLLNMSKTVIVRDAYYMNYMNANSLTHKQATDIQIRDIMHVYPKFWQTVNECSVSPSAYKYIIKDRFDFLINVFYHKVSDKMRRIDIAGLIINLYNDTKYRESFLLKDEVLISLIETKQRERLVEYLDARAIDNIYKFYLFGFLPFLSIRNKFRTRSYRIFGITIARRVFFLAGKE